KIVMQPSELNGFYHFLQSGNRRLTRGRGVMEDEPRAALTEGRVAGRELNRVASQVRGMAAERHE
ncbi:hypothetical protein, partial [Aeromonas dhakensis]|uniref:hypothetical protein n=1 Tax=Aeromonas dhakensis TaxID=196024 RepID=UPI0019D1B71B